MLDDADDCRARAAECRRLIRDITDAEMIDHLSLIANEYDAHADRLEATNLPAHEPRAASTQATSSRS